MQEKCWIFLHDVQRRYRNDIRGKDGGSRGYLAKTVTQLCAVRDFVTLNVMSAVVKVVL